MSHLSRHVTPIVLSCYLCLPLTPPPPTLPHNHDLKSARRMHLFIPQYQKFRAILRNNNNDMLPILINKNIFKTITCVCFRCKYVQTSSTTYNSIWGCYINIYILVLIVESTYKYITHNYIQNKYTLTMGRDEIGSLCAYIVDETI